MSIKNLEFSDVAAPKNSRGAMDTKTRARTKFLAAVSNQISAVEAAIVGETFTITKKQYVTDEDGTRRRVNRETEIRTWWFEQDGTFYLVPKYANQPLAIGSSKSKPSIVCGSELSGVLQALRAIKAAAEGKELDSVLEKQAVAARQRMSK